MDKPLVALVHSTRVVMEPINAAIERDIPEVRVVNLLDETLLGEFACCGGMNAPARRKLLSMLVSARESGVSLAVVTCSSLGDAVYEAERFAGVPTVKIDEPMVEEAVRRASVIGVLATGASAVRGTSDLITAVAKRCGKEVQVVEYLCKDAVAARARGVQAFNEYLAEEAAKACSSVDALVVSQMSMCGLTQCLGSEVPNLLTALPFAIPEIRTRLGL